MRVGKELLTVALEAAVSVYCSELTPVKGLPSRAGVNVFIEGVICVCNILFTSDG